MDACPAFKTAQKMCAPMPYRACLGGVSWATTPTASCLSRSPTTHLHLIQVNLLTFTVRGGVDGCLMALILLHLQTASPSSFKWTRHRGQAVAILIAAHATAQVPLDLDVTDGEVHTLLRLRSKQLVVYANLTSTQVELTPHVMVFGLHDRARPP